MERNKDVIRQDGVEFEAYRCVKCGEELMTMPQLRSLAAKYRRLRNARQVTFAKWGNSIAVRIPSDVAEECGISEGRQGLLTRDKQGIRIMPSG
ncbi:AbrB/MazE/SpoVT family DNA-binding domain-containing protein [Candidatus Woesearchaeota archaeon]|nr:AbrB/MazE/SpoVT family DNA-binding domain-containing protein [Candidatus Woesearchaeota archaeon]